METEEREVLEHLKTIKERVEYILKHYPETRNDDRYLWLMYVRRFCPEFSRYISFIPFEVLKKAPSFETLRRVRQKLQEEGRYLPTDPEILKRRRRLSRVWRNVVVRL